MTNAVEVGNAAPHKPITVPDISTRKGKDPIVCLTAYTTPMAKLLDRYCDVILVGDSVGMVLHGLDSTVGVTMEMMVLHGKAVARGCRNALLVVDMPFGSYEQSPEIALQNAVHIMQETGCVAVKLEGGEAMAETVEFLTRRGISVMGHVGLTPQSVHQIGGYKMQGIGADATRVQRDAEAIAAAGAFSIVLEKVAQGTAMQITEAIPVPTIGIGSSAHCDGQILVTEDILGLFADFQPKFARRYEELGDSAEAAIKAFSHDVRAGLFPGAEHIIG